MENFSVWYHGSPRDFDKFELNQKPSSRIGDGKSIYLTREYNLAKAFALQSRSGVGFIYSVIMKNEIGRKHEMHTINDDCEINPAYECIEVFDVNLLEIIKKEKISVKHE